MQGHLELWLRSPLSPRLAVCAAVGLAHPASLFAAGHRCRVGVEQSAGLLRQRQGERCAAGCAQVPCRPPGNIQVRVTSAAGSYIRLVLLQVRGGFPFSIPATATTAGCP